ncbi:hypothetical protein DL766_003098 [Monosporascus sp. MC13-8B]|nr:hypothetical protein DL763_006697 [Monosporascus cannonballus]RYP34197.1 hypothetical protein DL766_003098 [Monosporascus sp. MC13-8B]
MADIAVDRSGGPCEGVTKTGNLVAQPKDTKVGATMEGHPGGTSDTAQKDTDAASKGADQSSPAKGTLPGSSGDEGSHDGENAPADNGIAAPEGAGDVPVTVGDDAGEPVKKRKKRSKRKGGLTGHRNASGFEEYYADPPITPAEAAEEKDTYSHRMEECIQRYRARRRMDQEQTQMFNKYLFMGGIDSQPRQFTGMAMDTEALAEADKDQIRTMTAVDFIGGAGSRFYEFGEDEHWEVDFEGVVKGFLSRTIIDIYMYDEVAIEKASKLIKNFLNYVLQHDACPEYAHNVMAARNICDIAPLEMRATHELVHELPGIFNGAAASLFCGDERAVDDLDKPENFDKLVAFRLTVLDTCDDPEERKRLAGPMEDPASIRFLATKEETYEVRDIIRPRHKHKKVLEEQLAQMQLQDKVRPVGRAVLRPAIIEHGYDNLPRPDEVDLSDAPAEEYLLEDELLAKLERGMKLRLTVCELDVGGVRVRIIREVLDIRVSFDTFLPQALMAKWKDPVPNERPPPSVANPGAEEKAMDRLLAGDDD